MQERTTNFAKSIMESLADYIWYSPTFDPPLSKPVEGTNLEIPVEFGPEIREGDFLDFNVDIVPYSMQRRSPAERLQTISNAVERFIIPMAPLLAEEGKRLDIGALMDILSRYSNVPELRDLITNAPQPREGRGPVSPDGGRTRQSPTTTRTNVRVNRPGATRQGQTDVLSRLLVGGNVQDSEAASLTRRVG
jgi:hypothetical protein